MKFSIIVPVYNAEKYLNKCLDSIINQTYQDFELIIINDGSKDHSQQIINKYLQRYSLKIRSFSKENGGLSDARNYGVKKAEGDYIIFIDSDDYINEKLLEELEAIIKNENSDVIGYNIVNLNCNYEKMEVNLKPPCNNLNGEDAIIKLVSGKQYFEPACGFAYNLKYWNNNDFTYMKGIYHEDFALTPLVILKAQKVSFINFDGYYYIHTQNSITRNVDITEEKKRAYDLLKGYDYLYEEIEKFHFQNNYAKDMLLSYISNSVIFRLENIDSSLKKDFRKELKSRNIAKHILSDTLKRKIRKLLIRIKNRI